MSTLRRSLVLIVDPNDIFRSGCRALFSADQRFTVVADLASADRVRSAEIDPHPDIVVLDVGADATEGLAQLRTLRSAHEDAGVIVLTDDLSLDFLVEATDTGARAILLKAKLSGAFLLRAAELLANSEATVLDPSLLPLILRGARGQPAARPPSMVALTHRESEILRLLASGLSDQEIARSLGIARTTIHTHVSALLRKTLSNNRVQLGVVATQYGLLAEDAPGG